MGVLVSFVPAHEGLCKPTWLNCNQVSRRLGVTGFFRRTRHVWYWPWPIKYGPEFHGIIINGAAYSIDDILIKGETK